LFNKVIIGILVLFLVVIGGLGYYSFTLNRQLDRLDEKLAGMEAAQAARIDAVSGQIDKLRQETRGNFETLQGQLDETSSEINALSENLTSAGERIAGLEDETASLASNLTGLAGRVTETEKKLSGTAFDAGKVYADISRVTVTITDGQRVIGSGFIYDAQGHVVTAYHVIAGLSPIYVVMNDGTFSLADITGYSAYSDVGVLKLVNNTSVTPPRIADSSLVKIGDQVVAIGSPLGLKNTLTAGRVSQVNRYTSYETLTNWIANLIQFDAPVNPGNSGGPLINTEGEITGLVVARINVTEGDGIYWAVASNKFKRVADAIIAGGYFPYPWVGVSIRNITPQEARDKGLGTINGVYVTDVVSGSPARTAGILAGDIIVAEDGVTVNDVDELVSYLGITKSPGETVLLTIVRSAGTLEIAVEVGTRTQ
jgi:2-alkenal reductase